MHVATATEPALAFDETLVTAFERAAATFATGIAVGSNTWEPTYRELNETANRLAHRLIARSVIGGDRVAILMAHDALLIATIIAVLKTGAMAVVLDPHDPPARLTTIVEDAEPAVIVTDAIHRHLAGEIGQTGCAIIEFDADAAGGPVHNPAVDISPRQAAFLTYTSGTTGRPKGVLRTHRQMRRWAAAQVDAMQYSPSDRVALLPLTSTSLGSSSLCGGLLSGAMVCPFSVKARGIAGLADWMIGRQLTVYVSSASIFRALAKTLDETLVFSDMRTFRLASEAITRDDFTLFRRHFPRSCGLVHTLSSSETANVAWWRWSPDDEIGDGPIPVGHFSRDTEVLLLDDDGEPVARGDVGEIVIRSPYLANGYWRDPELTARRFSPEMDANGTRTFRTGDRGCINADGMLEFRGRNDDRIKIRGNRVELADVERALMDLPGIERAVVVALEREGRGPVLMAFAVARAGASWTPARLRRAARASLPLHMLPSRIHLVDGLPYNSNNKVDRQALARMALALPDEPHGDTPRTETEQLVADIWAEVLELPSIGRDSDFFALGGDSLSGAVVGARLHAETGFDLTLGMLADHPTVAALANAIDRRGNDLARPEPPFAPARRPQTIPMSLLQESLWNYIRDASPQDGLRIAHTYRISGPLDVEVLQRCRQALIGRHEILRTTFGVAGGQTVQVVHASSPPDISFIDLASATNPEAEAESRIRDFAARATDLGQLPIRQALLLRVAEQEFRLVNVTHPMVVDGFSTRLLDAQLAALYGAAVAGNAPPPPETAPLHYADHAVWQRDALRPDGPRFQSTVGWWRDAFAAAPPPARLPFRRFIRRDPFDPRAGRIEASLDDDTVGRLDALARQSGATAFSVRLAAFAALLAEASGQPGTVIATAIANRNRIETQRIVGPFLSTVHLVLPCDTGRSFSAWMDFVRDRVFDASTRADIPPDVLAAAGAPSPEPEFYFTMSSDRADRTLGAAVLRFEARRVEAMPRKCQIEFDETRPEACAVYFDAAAYDPAQMRALVDRYLKLLRVVASEPELPVRALLAKVGAPPRRWRWANRSAPVYEAAVKTYASSAALRAMLGPLKRLALQRR